MGFSHLAGSVEDVKHHGFAVHIDGLPVAVLYTTRRVLASASPGARPCCERPPAACPATPMVGSYSSRKLSVTMRMVRADFPTPPARCSQPGVRSGAANLRP